MIPAGSQSPQCTWQGKRPTIDSNCSLLMGNAKYYAMRYRVIDTARRVGETAGTRRFDVQLAGALQMPLKRRAASEIGPVSAKAERAFRFSGAPGALRRTPPGCK